MYDTGNSIHRQSCLIVGSDGREQATVNFAQYDTLCYLVQFVILRISKLSKVLAVI